MKKTILLLISVLALTSASFGQAAAKPAAPDAFDAIKVLVGDWEAKLESGKVIKVSYKLMSNDSIMVETFTTPSGKQTISVYHRDGSRLMVTHYCAQGNQPRLVLNGKKSTDKKFAFDFLDSTGLKSKDAEHMVYLEASILDKDHFDQTFTYEAGKEKETTTLHFERVG